MKNKFFKLFRVGIISAYFLLVSLNSNCQSISVSNILDFLKSQKSETIINLITSKQFKFYENKNLSDYGIKLKVYYKNTSVGKESFTFGKNNELFMILYHPVSKSYNSYKEKCLTPDFKFSYDYKNTNYYENKNTRIGVNDASGDISFFYKLNN